MEKKKMLYSMLGRSGLKISKIGYGNWINCEEDSKSQDLANQLVRKAFEGGINFFDTAESYGKGKGERQLGIALKNLGVPRSDYVVSTKIFNGDYPENSNTINNIGTSRKRIIEGVNRSLKNLQLDYVDVIFCHKWDANCPISEVIQAMKVVLSQGKAHYWATSNFPPVRLMEALLTCDILGCPRPIAEQTQYNMLFRESVENKFAMFTEDHGYGYTVWSPLAAGVLTGKYNDGIPEGSRFSLKKNENFKKSIYSKYMADEVREENVKKIRKLSKIANRLECSLAQLALAWNLVFRDVSTSIIGASKVEQLEENLGSLNVVDKLDSDVLVEIEGVLGNRPIREWDYRDNCELPSRR